jgi:hypothetical protein
MFTLNAWQQCAVQTSGWQMNPGEPGTSSRYAASRGSSAVHARSIAAYKSLLLTTSILRWVAAIRPIEESMPESRHFSLPNHVTGRILSARWGGQKAVTP